jgi:hypothetical protein
MANTNNSINNTIQKNSFSVNQSRAGVGTTFTVSQSSGTTGSSANLLLKVGGTAGGDPFTTYQVGTFQSWSEGNNNANTQQFRITPSTTLDPTPAVEISSVSSSLGCINYPLQPAFFSYLSTNLINAVPQNSNYTVVFDTIVYDQNNNYSTTSGIFTAPITGVYYFTSVSTVTGTLGNGATEIRYIIIGSGTNESFRAYKANPQTAPSVDNSNLTLGGQAFIRLNAGDTIQMQIAQFNGNSNTTLLGGAPSSNAVTFFQGFLVC